MNYISTRNTSKISETTASQAIQHGLADDGGLFMPSELPQIDFDYIEELTHLTYDEKAFRILSLFLTDYDKNTLKTDCSIAYSEERFGNDPACIKKITDGKYALELWHGPTCAFKDMALQIMPRLLSRALEITGETRKAHILVATSGDTGKAALEGYKDVPQIDITVFYPRDGVSDMQKLQMTTQEGTNVNVCSVNGNFDDAQSGVKRIFSDKTLSEKANENNFFFSSANSINWGRLAPQITYYFSAYCDLINSGEIVCGEKINFCVPTGNFGNIFAGYIAKKMGLPINKLICASNSNCVLTDFIEKGTYDRTRKFYKTMSPSMDILISSNLERLLWLISDPEKTVEYMKSLLESGKYTVSSEILSKIQAEFSGFCCNEEETATALKNTFETYHYLTDTHTAVAFGAYDKYLNSTGDMTKTVIVSTASPYKFPYDVCAALGNAPSSTKPSDMINHLEKITGTTAPTSLAKVLNLPIRFTKSVDPEFMEQVIFN